ncbi:uncharacterized protein ColSpa_01372 [Colletotrichum spaethianum]|uniref:Uncharacterized protein n=1 Tax=Colletotrichum spaethianum TaxID=700344 RepID=A0AA37L3Q7_9PEZI|nr:uncharacterized protein ColSpa_01372 [Colletotrichum spaethianum]GKT41191.1 hypothetical protein ColSpa_01372 [Colletotrichum spaethianum]
MNACGYITGLDWYKYEKGSTAFKRVWFNLLLLIKLGCVERTVRSTGGSKLPRVDKCFIDGPGLKRDLGVGKAAKVPPLAVPATTKSTLVGPIFVALSYSYGTMPLSHSHRSL